MVGRPTERLLGNPGPARVAVNPAPLGVRPPIARLFRLAWLPDVAVIARFAPLAVGIELFIKHSVSGRGAFFRGRFGSLADHGRSRRDRRLFGRGGRCCCRRRLPVRERFFTCLEIGLLLRETLFFRIYSFGGETVLDLALHLGLSFFFGLLFLAGNKKSQGCDQWENGELLHGVVRQADGLLIRMKLLANGNDGTGESVSRGGRCRRRRRNGNDRDFLDLIAPCSLHIRIDREQRQRDNDNDHELEAGARRTG